jgi:uncharacterized OsmC-like protein
MSGRSHLGTYPEPLSSACATAACEALVPLDAHGRCARLRTFSCRPEVSALNTDTLAFNRFRKGLRTVTLPLDGEISLGIPTWVAEAHPAAFPTPDSYVQHTGTFEYLVAAVAGCLIDHYGFAVEARGLPAVDGCLTSEAYGEVVAEADGCLMIAAVHIHYRLQLPAGRDPGADRVALARALATHTRKCPIARTLRGRTKIVASLDLVGGEGNVDRIGPASSNVDEL